MGPRSSGTSAPPATARVLAGQPAPRRSPAARSALSRGNRRRREPLRPRHAPQAPAGAVVPAAPGDGAAPGARALAAGARLRRRGARDLHGAAAEGRRAGPRGSEPGAPGDRAHPRLRLPADGAAVRALGAVRRARAASRSVADRGRAVPGDVRRAAVRGRQRRTLLELLHLLRLARLRAAVRLLACAAPTSG